MRMCGRPCRPVRAKRGLTSCPPPEGLRREGRDGEPGRLMSCAHFSPTPLILRRSCAVCQAHIVSSTSVLMPHEVPPALCGLRHINGVRRLHASAGRTTTTNDGPTQSQRCSLDEGIIDPTLPSRLSPTHRRSVHHDTGGALGRPAHQRCTWERPISCIGVGTRSLPRATQGCTVGLPTGSDHRLRLWFELHRPMKENTHSYRFGTSI